MNKFKVGQRVRCIGTEKGGPGDGDYERGGGMGWELGLEFTVEKISREDTTNPVYWRPQSCGGVYEDHLRSLSLSLEEPRDLQERIDKEVDILKGGE